MNTFHESPVVESDVDDDSSKHVEHVEHVEHGDYDATTEREGTRVVEGIEGQEPEEEVLVLDESPHPDSVLPVWEPTGNLDVDTALEQLHDLSASDSTEHAAVYEGIERALRGTLDGLAAEEDSV